MDWRDDIRGDVAADEQRDAEYYRYFPYARPYKTAPADVQRVRIKEYIARHREQSGIVLDALGQCDAVWDAYHRNDLSEFARLADAAIRAEFEPFITEEEHDRD